MDVGGWVQGPVTLTKLLRFQYSETYKNILSKWKISCFILYCSPRWGGGGRDKKLGGLLWILEAIYAFGHTAKQPILRCQLCGVQTVVQAALLFGLYDSADAMVSETPIADKGAVQTLAFSNRMTVQIPEVWEEDHNLFCHQLYSICKATTGLLLDPSVETQHMTMGFSGPCYLKRPWWNGA